LGVTFNPHKTVWVGEPAADILTQHLRPEKFILYSKANYLDIIKNYILIPDKQGEIEIFQML
jgi:hypothetical protein